MKALKDIMTAERVWKYAAILTCVLAGTAILWIAYYLFVPVGETVETESQKNARILGERYHKMEMIVWQRDKVLKSIEELHKADSGLKNQYNSEAKAIQDMINKLSD